MHMTSFRHPIATMPSTSRQAISRDLRELVERLPLPAALVGFDVDQSIVLLNESFLKAFGYALADIPTVGEWALRAHPDEAYRCESLSVWNAAVAKARNQTGRVESMEFRFTCRDGTVRDVVCSAAVTGDFLLVTCIDVTERRRAEAELRARQAAIDRTAYELTENIPVGTYTMVQPPDGGTGRFEFMSERFLEICGLDAEEARRDPLNAFACVHPEDYDEWVRKNAEVFANRQPFFGECRVVAGGQVRWISAESSPRDLPDGSTVWEGVLIDTTRQKLAEAALAEALEQERQQEEAHRRDLESKLRTSLTAAATAHEIKQPLGRILLETQLALERLRQAPLRQRQMGDYLEDMLRESRHVVDMLGRIKALLRNVRSDHGPVDLSEVVASAVLFSRPLLTEHGITIREAGLDRSVPIHGDSVQLQTAVINLIRNAAEALTGVPPAQRMIVIEVADDHDVVAVAVGDAGPGMSPEQIAAAPFATSKPDGSGLGLYLVRTCMENHGGTITIRRSPLGGAEVRLTLPRNPDRETK
jgi:PAS domain S-box-containing protein